LYKHPEFSPLEKIERLEDLRAVENIMGKLVFLMSYRRYSDAWETLWCKENEPTLTLNDGKYVGTEAVKSWFVDYQNAITAKANALMRERYPKELGSLSEAETFGAGFNEVLNATTPLIELAYDRETAKGVWYCYGEQTVVTDDGLAAYWNMGRYGADFVKENGVWKLWHLQFFTDFVTPVGQKFNNVKGNISVSGIEPPAYSEEGVFFTALSKETASLRKPEMPVEYKTFAETFSY